MGLQGHWNKQIVFVFKALTPDTQSVLLKHMRKVSKCVTMGGHSSNISNAAMYKGNCVCGDGPMSHVEIGLKHLKRYIISLAGVGRQSYTSELNDVQDKQYHQKTKKLQRSRDEGVPGSTDIELVCWKGSAHA